MAWGCLRSGLALAACGLALTGCSGTRFGDQLSRSFSASPAQPVSPSPNPAPANPAPAKPAPPKPVTPDGAAPKPPAVQATAKSAGAASTKPAPYRITIQLPAADPAAPAEAVTEALRAAGVSFEVEMIERIGGSTPKPAPTVMPAPAPR